MATPRITIGLAVYNGERYVASAIGSILRQTFTDFELLIADNASTDGTRRIVESIAATDPRIRYIGADRNHGGAWNHNRLVREARGEFFMWAGHDDLFAPTYLERCLAAFAADPDAVYVLADNVLIDQTDRIQGVEINRFRVDDRSPSRRYFDILIVQGGHNTYGLIRTATMRSLRPHASVPRGERILYAELSLRGRFHVLHEPLFFRRVHQESTTSMRSSRSAEAIRLEAARATWWRHQTPVLLAEYFAGFLDAIVRSPISRREKVRALLGLTRWVVGHVPGLSVRDERARRVELDASLRGVDAGGMALRGGA